MKTATGIALVISLACLMSAVPGVARVLPLNKKHGKHAKKNDWRKSLDSELSSLEDGDSDHLGLYVKDLSTGREYSHKANEWWYVASGVKVPIAVAVFKDIEAGKFTLDTKLVLNEDDFVDGAGQTNSYPVGSRLTVRFLLEQMLIHSDNTASDLLIRAVSLDRVNSVLKSLVPEGFGPITTLGDVRRGAYSAFDPDAGKLRNRDFRDLKAISTEGKKLEHLAQLLKRKSTDFHVRTLDAAFDSYYSTHVNSATLQAYGTLLEKIARGEALGRESTSELVAIMKRVETGKERIIKGFPRTVSFAHKTGTQHARICDFGIAWNEKSPTTGPVIVASCVRGVTALSKSEKILARAGKALARSGLFEGGNDAQ